MAVSIERLLRLAADYHNFCSSTCENDARKDSDELNEDDLDFIAAAGIPAALLTDEDDFPPVL